jgi:hypothetical protein
VAFTEALRLIIDADTKGAVQGIEKVGKTADRELGRTDQTLDRLGNGLTKAGAGMVAFGAAALVGLGAMARESEQANLAQVKLQNTLDNMPKLAGASAGEFNDLANSIQKVTAADADAIVEAEALLGTFNLTAQEIKGVTPLVVDYARKFGLDIPAAAVQVGKALDGQVGALKRNGVSIDEVLFKTDRYRAVTEALSDQVGGFAEAEGKTFAGSLERMKNELGDLAEGVGGGAVEAFTTLFSAVEKGANALESISPGAQSAIGKFATFGAVGLTAAGALNFVAGQAILARSNITTMTTAISGGITKMGGLKMAAGMAGAAGALVALAGAAEMYNQQQKQMNISKMTNEFLAAGDSMEDMRDVINTLVGQGPTELVGTFAALAETNREAAERFIETAEAAGASGRVIREMKEHLETTGAAQRQTTQDTEEGTGAYEDAADAAQTYSDVLKGLFDPLFGVLDAQQRLADANAEVTGAEWELVAAIQEHGADSLEAMAATEKLRQAQIDATQAAAGQAGAMDGLRRGLQDGSIDINEARRRLDEFVTSGLISADTAAAFRAELDKLDGKTVNVAVVTRYSQIGTASILPGTRNIPQRAAGGPVRAGQAYIVGEKNAELFIPNENGMIWPNVPSSIPAGSGSGSGGGVAVAVRIDVSGGDQMLMEWLRRRIQVEHGGNVQNALGYKR